ncbi:MAG: hypothetical protein VR72_14455 [Clostridiaceae bacterium BRH_c20a]|nr:MAG: hypothetical protein VR72_14455 [Clostridiaceae bacterium BRH_c20a]
MRSGFGRLEKKNSNDYRRLGEQSIVFLQFIEYEILNNAGKVTTEIAKAFAESEFEKYCVIQDRLFESDFDKFAKGLKIW